MAKLTLRAHPGVIFAYSPNNIELILRVENTNGRVTWVEAEVFLPDRLSLGPDSNVLKGRLRLGILERDHALEKTVRIYANNYTKPQMYRCKVILFTYDRDGIIDKRLEKPIDIRCELKKESVL